MGKLDIQAWRERFKADIEAAGFKAPRGMNPHIDYLLGQLQERIDRAPEEKREAVMAKLKPVAAIEALREQDIVRGGVLCLTSDFVFFAKAPFMNFKNSSALLYLRRREAVVEVAPEEVEDENISIIDFNEAIKPMGLLDEKKAITFLRASDKDAEKFIAIAQDSPDYREGGMFEPFIRGFSGQDFKA